MKRLRLALSLLLGAALLASAPASHPQASADMPWRTPLHQDLATVLPLACPDGSCFVLQVQRQAIDRQIAHYTITLRTGPGAEDLIRLHRVVREVRPWYPRRSRDTIFLQHGEAKDFTGMFLPGPGSSVLPGDFGLAAHLAHGYVDVWGIDQAWALVPAEAAEFSFMEGWDLQRQVDDLSLGLAIAEALRTAGGNRPGAMHLLGFGAGAAIGFALLNEEARLPAARRTVEGFVPVDMTYTTDTESLRSFMCGQAAEMDALLSAGTRQREVPLCSMCNLCTCDPEGSSPYFPGMTNHQAALHEAAGPIYGETPIHNLAGDLHRDGSVLGLLHTEPGAWMEYMESAVAFQPVELLRDQRHLMCGDVDLPYDDFLGEVEVPVFYLSAAGGFGIHGNRGLQSLHRAEITTHMVQLEPPARVNQDFGHLDLLTASDAPTLAWEPLLEWLRSHPPTPKPGGGPGRRLNRPLQREVPADGR